MRVGSRGLLPPCRYRFSRNPRGGRHRDLNPVHSRRNVADDAPRALSVGGQRAWNSGHAAHLDCRLLRTKAPTQASAFAHLMPYESFVPGSSIRHTEAFRIMHAGDWLGRQDSNLRMAAPKAAALPLGDAPSGGSVPTLFAIGTQLDITEHSPLERRADRRYKARHPRWRSIAQSGSAPRSGRGGRKFESCYSDHSFSRLSGIDRPFGAT